MTYQCECVVPYKSSKQKTAPQYQCSHENMVHIHHKLEPQTICKS